MTLNALSIHAPVAPRTSPSFPTLGEKMAQFEGQFIETGGDIGKIKRIGEVELPFGGTFVVTNDRAHNEYRMAGALKAYQSKLKGEQNLQQSLPAQIKFLGEVTDMHYRDAPDNFQMISDVEQQLSTMKTIFDAMPARIEKAASELETMRNFFYAMFPQSQRLV